MCRIPLLFVLFWFQPRIIPGAAVGFRAHQLILNYKAIDINYSNGSWNGRSLEYQFQNPQIDLNSFQPTNPLSILIILQKGRNKKLSRSQDFIEFSSQFVGEIFIKIHFPFFRFMDFNLLNLFAIMSHPSIWISDHVRNRREFLLSEFSVAYPKLGITCEI